MKCAGRAGRSRAPAASLRDGLRPPWTVRPAPGPGWLSGGPSLVAPVRRSGAGWLERFREQLWGRPEQGVAAFNERHHPRPPSASPSFTACSWPSNARRARGGRRSPRCSPGQPAGAPCCGTRRGVSHPEWPRPRHRDRHRAPSPGNRRVQMAPCTGAGSVRLVPFMADGSANAREGSTGYLHSCGSAFRHLGPHPGGHCLGLVLRCPRPHQDDPARLVRERDLPHCRTQRARRIVRHGASLRRLPPTLKGCRPEDEDPRPDGGQPWVADSMDHLPSGGHPAARFRQGRPTAPLSAPWNSPWTALTPWRWPYSPAGHPRRFVSFISPYRRRRRAGR